MDISTLWTTHFAALVRYLRGFTRSEAEAEDLAQATFVKALEHAAELMEMSEAHAKAWLWRAGYHAFIDSVRKSSRHTALDDTDHPAYEEDFSGVHVLQSLEQLSAPLRKVVTMRYLMGYTSAEIGNALSIPPATVRTRLRAAMILLRKYEQRG